MVERLSLQQIYPDEGKRRLLEDKAVKGGTSTGKCAKLHLISVLPQRPQ